MYNQISILRHNIYGAVNFGADFKKLCERLNITPEQLNDGEGYIQWDPGDKNDFWSHALEMTGNPCLGLHMGQGPGNPFAFGILGMLMQSSKTLKDAIEVICKYNDTLTGVFQFTFEPSGDHYQFNFNPIPLWENTNPESARQASDLFASAILNAFNHASTHKVLPIEVHFRYSQRHLLEYQKFLRAPIIFSSKNNCFIFSKETINAPIISYDESLYSTFSNLLHQKQKKLKGQLSTAEKVRSILLTSFNGQSAPIEIIASRMNMTTRTLQRKLSEESTSYRSICNQLRRELMDDLIRLGRSKKGDIAVILGFADTSSFRRALKKWNK